MNDELKILVAVGYRDFALNIQDILNDEGYTTALVYDGKSALEMCLMQPFDLVILDFKLPDTNGLQLQKRLPEFTEADFIIITGDPSIESAAKTAQGKRIVKYESKPLNMKRFLAIIRDVSERRNARN